MHYLRRAIYAETRDAQPLRDRIAAVKFDRAESQYRTERDRWPLAFLALPRLEDPTPLAS